MKRQDAKDAKTRQEPSPHLDQLAHETIGAALAVHRGLGPGFMENVYERSLAVELEERNIPFDRQAPCPIYYRGVNVGKCRVDLVIDNALIVELKTVESIAAVHRAQLRSYLKATGHHLGLLINFNVPLLKDGIERVICSSQ